MIEKRGMTLMIKPDMVDDYVKAHDTIWPEVKMALQGVGVTNISIFLAPDENRLFMCMEYTGEEHFEAAMVRYAAMPKVADWEALMQTMQLQIPGSAPGKWWQDCSLLFRSDF
mmetsp:Transcript_1952/g.3033  ORF Transcript_1952/g.3033 Transcript_1952/m.3033 type:complete len:113 (-) Transcript_1952:1053-1391(-)